MNKEIDCLVYETEEDLRCYFMDYFESEKMTKKDIINIESNPINGKVTIWFWNNVVD